MRRTTLIAAVVFVALLAAATWAVTRKPERGIKRMSFASLAVDQIDRVMVTGPKPIELKKDGATWRLQNQREANPEVVQAALAGARRMVSSDVLSEETRRSEEFEVDAAKGTHVALYAGKRALAEFTVGKTVPHGVAVKVDDVVFRADGAAHPLFVRAPKEWMQRRLFADKRGDVARLNVRLKNQPPYTLVRTQDTWQLVQDAATPATDFRLDSDAAQALVGAIVDLRAQDILDADPGVETTQLSDASDTLTLFIKPAANPTETADAKDAPEVIRTLHIGAARDDQGVYARLAGRNDVFVLSPVEAGEVRKKRDDLRDMRLVEPFDYAKVRRLAAVNGKKSWHLVRQGDTWAPGKGVAVPPKFALDLSRVTQRLEMLANSRGTGLAAEATPVAAGLAPPKASLTVTLEDDRQLTLSFGNKAKGRDDTVYAMGADGKVYEVAIALRDTLLGDVQSFQRSPEAQSAVNNPSLDSAALNNLPPQVRAALEKQLAGRREQALP